MSVALFIVGLLLLVLSFIKALDYTDANAALWVVMCGLGALMLISATAAWVS